MCRCPGADGFDVVRAISAKANHARSAATRFVFVTAHDQYAVRAFEVHAFDYLLKPVGEERFREVLRRAQEQHQRNGDVSEKRLRGLIDQVLRDRGFSRTAADSRREPRVFCERSRDFVGCGRAKLFDFALRREIAHDARHAGLDRRNTRSKTFRADQSQHDRSSRRYSRNAVVVPRRVQSHPQR